LLLVGGAFDEGAEGVEPGGFDGLVEVGVELDAL
jgi:hypothetical protein